MTSKEIQAALVGNFTRCLWNPARVTAVHNTTGLVGWEADTLILHKSGYIWEIEVKISVSDFRREFKAKSKVTKHKHMLKGIRREPWYGKEFPNLVQKFFFAMPEALYEKVKAEVPDHAGVIVIRERTTGLSPLIVKKPKTLPATKDPTAKDRFLTAVYFKHWNHQQ